MPPGNSSGGIRHPARDSDASWRSLSVVTADGLWLGGHLSALLERLPVGEVLSGPGQARLAAPAGRPVASRGGQALAPVPAGK